MPKKLTQEQFEPAIAWIQKRFEKEQAKNKADYEEFKQRMNARFPDNDTNKPANSVRIL